MRALITGAGGFVGGHLIDYLLSNTNLDLFAAVFDPPGQNPQLDNRPIEQEQVDLRDPEATRQYVNRVLPDYIFHLAALADVGQSFRNPWDTLSNNIQAQLNLLQAIYGLNLPSRILIVSSAEIYGSGDDPKKTAG